MKKLLALIGLLSALAAPAFAGVCSSYPYTLTNGQVADANQVMADFNLVRNCFVNSGASNGANSDITSLSGLSTPLSIAQGGTGGTTGQPSGAAGGRLTGTYPNPTISATGVSSGYYAFGNFTVSSDGTISGASAGANFTGDTGSGGAYGLVPAPPSGSAALGYLLGAGGSWVAPFSLPSQSGNAYKALTTNGSASAWSGFPVTAYANVSCTTSGCVLGQEEGVTSVTRSGTGNYTVNLSGSFSSLVPVATSSQYITLIQTVTVNSVQVLTFQTPSTAADAGFNIIIMGH